MECRVAENFTSNNRTRFWSV